MEHLNGLFKILRDALGDTHGLELNLIEHEEREKRRSEVRKILGGIIQESYENEMEVLIKFSIGSELRQISSYDLLTAGGQILEDKIYEITDSSEIFILKSFLTDTEGNDVNQVGTMGSLFMGDCIIDGKHLENVVIKLPENPRSTNHLEALKEEGNVLGTSSFTCVEKLIHYSERGVLVTQYIKGKNLATLIPTLSISQKYQTVNRLVVAIDTIHKSGIAHHDIKPSNVMMEDGSEEIIFVDLGEPKLQEGVNFGTIQYMPPESIDPSLKETKDPFKVDIFAAGLVVFEILTGKSFFDIEFINDNLPKVILSNPNYREREKFVISIAKYNRTYFDKRCQAAGLSEKEIEFLEPMLRREPEQRKLPEFELMPGVAEA